MRALSVLAFGLLIVPAVSAQTAGADTLATDSVEVAVARPAPPAPEPRTPEMPPPPPRPTLHAFGATGLRVTLPAGWTGPVAAADAQAERYALYTFENAADHPLAGTTLRVERVQGLNQLVRQRFQQGQTGYGYHGTRPIGPAATPLPGLGMEVEGPGTAGAVVFLQRGLASWTVQIEAPASVWAAHRGEVLTVLAGVEIP